MAGVNGRLLDNVCCSQDGAIMTGSGRARERLFYRFRDTGTYTKTTARLADQRKFPTPIKRRVWTQLTGTCTD